MAKSGLFIGGIAGLSAGCYGRMNGYDTTIFEMHETPGGGLPPAGYSGRHLLQVICKKDGKEFTTSTP